MELQKSISLYLQEKQQANEKHLDIALLIVDKQDV